MIEGLDNFSRHFAESLFREFPEFERHARVVDGELIGAFTPEEKQHFDALSKVKPVALEAEGGDA